RAPDRPTSLDIACLAQGCDGIALDRSDVQKVIEEPIDDAGSVQQCRRHPMVGQCLQPCNQNILAELGIAFSDVLEAVQHLLVIGAACTAQAKACQIARDQLPFGIRPCRHDSTSDSGTSSAMALRSSVASLR